MSRVLVIVSDHREIQTALANSLQKIDVVMTTIRSHSTIAPSEREKTGFQKTIANEPNLNIFKSDLVAFDWSMFSSVREVLDLIHQIRSQGRLGSKSPLALLTPHRLLPE